MIDVSVRFRTNENGQVKRIEMEYSKELIRRMKKAFIRLLPDLKKAEQSLADLIARTASEIEDKSLVRVQARGMRRLQIGKTYGI